ncbi:MAG TPA: hypothetical protein VFT30_02125, partial [Nitrospira sp.]|nr:hypothetical protein [Nitrospira sp.]
IVDCDDWLSINLIGFDWYANWDIAQRVGGRSPKHIAGRTFIRGRLGDEGMCNTVPRKIMKGFVVGHLTFGPQNLTEHQQRVCRKMYEEIVDEYQS